jgi:4-hydroxy-4-methyl-2-oxoglutarate aldolase
MCLFAASGTGSYFGELLALACKLKGVQRIVHDCYVRDGREIIQMDFACFARGLNPTDSAGRIAVTACNVPVMCAGVQIHPGDLVVADFDGVVVVPKQVLPDALGIAEEKLAKERHVRSEIVKGRSLRSIFDDFGAM